MFSLGELDLSSWIWWTQRPDLCLKRKGTSYVSGRRGYIGNHSEFFRVKIWATESLYEAGGGKPEAG